MRLRDARKLHNGDQVTIKRNILTHNQKETVVIIRAYKPTEDPTSHYVDVMTSDGFWTLSHRDIL